MDREQQVEWQALESRAQTEVREPPESPRGYRFVASLFISPSFEGCRMYWVALPLSPEVATAKAWRRRWSKEEDSLKFGTPIERLKHGHLLAPTTETIEVDLPRVRVEALLRPLAEGRITPFADDPGVVLDGTTYSLRLGTDHQGAEFRWWEKAPSGWEALEHFGRELGRAVEENEHRAG